jgi:hypothetical protein
MLNSKQAFKLKDEQIPIFDRMKKNFDTLEKTNIPE